LINILAGLALADSGSLAVLGHDVRADYRQARRSIGVVPQELVYDVFFTVREMVAEGSRHPDAGHYRRGSV
jgi:ABC-2 type transport system ATP-binding protein